MRIQATAGAWEAGPIFGAMPFFPLFFIAALCLCSSTVEPARSDILYKRLIAQSAPEVYFKMNANSTWRIRYCPGSAFLGNSYDGCRYIHGGGDTVFFFWGDTAVWAAKYVANLAGDTLRLTYLEGKDFFIDLLEQSGIKEWTFVKLGSAVIPCD